MHSTKLTISAIFFLMLVQNHVSTLPPPCGRRLPQIVPLIMNGSTVHQHWPWHAAIYHVKTSESIPSYEYKCGGTLISSKWILTAGHCVSHYETPMPTNKVSVSLGRLNLSENETTSAQSFNVSEIVLHQNYTSFDLNNDIALVRVSREAMFTYYVQPICLWNSNQTSLSEIIGKAATVIGWGETEAGQMSSILREASLTVVNTFDCLDVSYNTVGRFLTATKFCAGKLDGTNICFGDSGGSVAFEDNGQYHIRGIVSMTAKKPKGPSTYICDTMQYALFTDVAQFLPWIRDATIDCEIKVDCSDQNSRFEPSYLRDDSRDCSLVNTANSSSTHKCRFTFEEISNTIVVATSIYKLDEVNPVNRAKLKIDELIRHSASGTVLTIDLKSEDITYLDPNTFDNVTRVERLDLSHNNLSELTVNVFKELQSLNHLDLSSNNLSELHVDLFENLVNLRFLYLSDNQFKFLPGQIFRNNLQLYEVRLDRNHLNEIHEDLFATSENMVQLSLQLTPIVTLPKNLFRSNQKMLRIWLSQNKLKEIHVDTFRDLREIWSLWLNINEIEILPANVFRYNGKLTSLNLCQNNISEFHVNLFNELHILQSLWLCSNPVEVLPPGLFRNNRKLTYIYLYNNRLKELHVDIFKDLRQLEQIILDGNQLEVLPPGLFRTNRRLSIIELRRNRIRTIASTFQHLKKLQRLALLENVCVDEDFNVENVSSIDIENRIQDKCQN